MIAERRQLGTTLFKRQKDWEIWLNKNHVSSTDVWMKLAKKASGQELVSYDQALEVALCYGWIDGKRKSKDSAIHSHVRKK